AGFCPERIVNGYFKEEESVRRALEMARAGDLLVIFGDKLARIWEEIVSFKPAVEVRERVGEEALVGAGSARA
ncbi:MAG TPA: hypothetical protein VIJ61_04400, partial [Thermoanaerobaculia bacterium]